MHYAKSCKQDRLHCGGERGEEGWAGETPAL